MEHPSQAATNATIVDSRDFKPSIPERICCPQAISDSAMNAVPVVTARNAEMPTNFRTTSSTSLHPHDAMRIAVPLLHEFYDSPSFSCYAPLDAAVAERWIREDHEHIIDGLEHTGMLDSFRRSLEIYCRKLSAAGALANEFVFGGADDENAETDTDQFFPGLSEQIAKKTLERPDELPVLVAMLTDRLKCRASYMRDHPSIVPPHSARRPIDLGFCDFEKIKGGPTSIAYLLRTKDASWLLRGRTREPYMLVVNAQPGTTVQSLTRGASFDYEDIETEPGHYQRYLTFSGGMLSIRALQNERTLLLFRRQLPVIYLLGGGTRVVEYEWNPVAYGRSFLEKTRTLHNEYSGGTRNEDISPQSSVRQTKRMLISEIRAIPMLQLPGFEPRRDR